MSYTPSLRDIISKLNEADEQTGPAVDVVTGPAHWASYLINGDDSSMTPEELEACHRWQQRIEPWYVVSTTDDEERFTNHYALHSGTEHGGGTVIDYIVHKDRAYQKPDDSMSHNTSADTVTEPSFPPSGAF